MKQHVIVIDYGSGNLRSVVKALEHVAPKNTTISLTSESKSLETASHIILPGVGAFGDCLDGLNSLKDMREALEKSVFEDKKPFLGICVGMQLLAEKGLEHGQHQGLGWIKGTVSPIDDQNGALKIPHMGWNELVIKHDHPVFKGIKSGDHAYFVHSYHFECDEKQCIMATVDYGKPLVAALAKDNIIATQFHPEKSQQAGLKLLENFMRMPS